MREPIYGKLAVVVVRMGSHLLETIRRPVDDGNSGQVTEHHPVWAIPEGWTIFVTQLQEELLCADLAAVSVKQPKVCPCCEARSRDMAQSIVSPHKEDAPVQE